MNLNSNLQFSDLQKLVVKDLGYSRVPFISDSTRFWLVRTQGGDFYDEFIEKKFIALGYNDIDESIIHKYRELEKNSNTIKGKDSFKKFQKEISKKYNSNQVGHIISKCEKFIFEFKENDIVVIPDKSNNNLSFVRLKKYQSIDEEKLRMSEKEYLNLVKFNRREDINIELFCPYRKRWTIDLLLTIDKSEIQDNLYKGLIPSQSLYNMDSYSDIILSHIYMIYFYKNKLYINFNVTKDGDIRAKDYSEFIFLLNKYIETINFEIDVSIKSNVSSPGQIILILGELSSECLSLLDSKMSWFIIIYIMVVGGNFGNFKINSLYDIYMSLKEKKQRDRELDQRDRELDQKDKELMQRDRELTQRDRELTLEEMERIKETSMKLEIDNIKRDQERNKKKHDIIIL